MKAFDPQMQNQGLNAAFLTQGYHPGVNFAGAVAGSQTYTSAQVGI